VASDFFGIELAGAVGSFVGVEYDQLAIKSARQNATTRKIANGEFVAAKAEEVLPELLKKYSPEKTAVILDPPRKGCQPEILQLLRETKPAQSHLCVVSSGDNGAGLERFVRRWCL
jgi:tRNA/tmRNA/rRNA uracil-C5-methylase (TrmA/RlmC/RlmD family)